MNKIILFLVILLSSCTNIPFSFYKSSFDGIRESLLKLDSVELNDSYMEEKKFPIIRLRFGNSRSVILVLVDESNEVKRWISADRIFVYTYKGKVIETVGLQNDFKIRDYDFPDELSYQSNHTNTYIIDFFEPRLLNQYALSEFELLESTHNRSSCQRKITIEC